MIELLVIVYVCVYVMLALFYLLQLFICVHLFYEYWKIIWGEGLCTLSAL